MDENFKKKIDFKYDLKIIFDLMKKYIIMFISIMIISFLIEAGTTITYLLFKYIVDKGSLYNEGQIEKPELIAFLLNALFIFIILLLTVSLLKWIKVQFCMSISIKSTYYLKNKYLAHLLYLSHDFHSTHKSGILISRLSRGSKAFDLMLNIVVSNISPIIFQLITIGGAILFYNWKSAIIILLTIAAFLSFNFIIQKVQESSSLLINEVEDSEKGMVSDIFNNIDTIKYYGKENIVLKKIKEITNVVLSVQFKQWKIFRWWEFGQTLILGTGGFFLVVFSILSFINKEINLGTLVFIYTGYVSLISPLFMFVFGLKDFYYAIASLDTLFQYSKLQNNIKDLPNAKNIIITKGIIEFKNISFKYKNNEVVNKISIKINANEKVALVGHSGCGKTTVLKLLYRLYDVDDGMILIDGYDIKSVKQESLRSEMAIVQQECLLFNDTIYNNIAFSMPDASPKEVREAMEFAQLSQIIEKFHDKENTIVGEKGVRLSGGEKQRVSIARAVLANKKIILLDEATSSLDLKAEYELQKVLKNLLENRTAIIIAHRLSTIMNADRVVVLENGLIIQEGKHSELVKEKGPYQKLWELHQNGYLV